MENGQFGGGGHSDNLEKKPESYPITAFRLLFLHACSVYYLALAHYSILINLFLILYCCSFTVVW